jgi:hydrogenase maturation protease
MTADDVVVIGVGNSYRRDDGVGLVVAADIAERALPGLRVRHGVAESSAFLDAWSGARLAIVVDAAVTPGAVPGRVRRFTSVDDFAARPVSSHGLDLAQAMELGTVLGRVPAALVLYTVDVDDTGYGAGLTPAVAAAVPWVAGAVVDEALSATDPASARRRIPRSMPRVISAVTGPASSDSTTSPG